MAEVIRQDWAEGELQRALDETIRRSAVDADFRKLAIADGAAAVAKVNPKPLPPGMAFQFLDNSGLVKSVPLPPLEAADGEISERELEAVAGGISIEISIKIEF
jgi:hypothetical protein